MYEALSTVDKICAYIVLFAIIAVGIPTLVYSVVQHINKSEEFQHVKAKKFDVFICTRKLRIIPVCTYIAVMIEHKEFMRSTDICSTPIAYMKRSVLGGIKFDTSQEMRLIEVSWNLFNYILNIRRGEFSMSVKDVINKFYGAYDNQTPETYFESIRNTFSVNGVCVTKEQEEKCQSILDKYTDERLYAYCCGELIPMPAYHDNTCVKLMEELCAVMCKEVLDD